MTEGTTVLIVDDEPAMLDLLRMNLEDEGFSVRGARNGPEALQRMRDDLPDAVLLDVVMPYMDGFETLAAMRDLSTAPVIMLTARDGEIDRVRALDLGADGYLTKPWSHGELLARLHAALRRAAMPPAPRRTDLVIDDDLTIDFNRRAIVRQDALVHLRPTEFRLLYHLVSNAGRLLTHQTLLSKVWGYEYSDEDHYLRLYIGYLRQKIEVDPARPRYILTERGLGYRFRELARVR